MNTLIIKIESGVVAEVYSTVPAKIIVVDYDLIEGDEIPDCRMRKAVLSMAPDEYIKQNDIDTRVKDLVVQCSRPDRRPAAVKASEKAA
jgi:hypothetical protein